MRLLKLHILPLLLILAACAANPFQTAQTVEQKGDALYGSYVIAKEQGAAILQTASVTDEVKRPVAQAMVDSKPVGDALQDSLIQYASVKAQVDQGTTPQDRLVIVEQNVSDWITKATPLINRLIDAVGGLLK
jgi:hypothetical protein